MCNSCKLVSVLLWGCSVKQTLGADGVLKEGAAIPVNPCLTQPRPSSSLPDATDGELGIVQSTESSPNSTQTAQFKSV